MNKLRLIRLILSLTGVMLLTTLKAGAALILQPSHLRPGDPYRLVFVTSTFRNATSTDIQDYNQFVQAAAANSPLATLGQTWWAIGSTPAVDARDNTNTNPISGGGPGVPVYLVDGSLLASSNADLWDGELMNAINIDERGNELRYFDNDTVWTGSQSDGTRAQLDMLGGPIDFSMRGRARRSDLEWIRERAETNLGAGRLYGISDVILAIPEPSTLLPVGLTIILLGWRLRC